MTRDGWAACADPVRMLEVVRNRASGRKLRLFACALVRRCRWGDAQKTVLGIAGRAEDWAGGRATRWEALAAYRLADAAPEDRPAAALVTALLLRVDAPLAAAVGLSELGRRVGPGACAGVLRCLFGNPCPPAPARKSRLPSFLTGLLGGPAGNPAPLPAVVPDPSWLTPTVVALARLAYDAGDFSVLPILADALQDAGCIDEDVLNHCRGPDEHVKGCWCLDMLLGKS